MRRLLPAFLAALALGALPEVAGAQTFTLVAPPPAPAPALPSFELPNAPGSITVPFALGPPPAQPEARSYEQLLLLWQEAGAAYGVPWQVLGAINKIESNFGQNMGPSSAGALGWMQFIPSSWMRWGMDGDGDGVADPWDPEDAVYAAARYLAAAGAHEDLERAIFAYNHAQWYVDDVLETAALFGDDTLGLGLSGFVFQQASLEAGLADARRRVVVAKRATEQVEEELDELAGGRLALERRAGNPRLSDRDFRRVESRLGRLDEREAEANGRLLGLREDLEEATAALASLRERQASAVAGGGPLDTAAPVAGGEWVFPVGGGPELVSVAHSHHDYPAADIAAPEGSPLYALASSVVTEAYPQENGRCGIGLKLRTESGSVFAYCHLSYLEPDVVPGAALSAGAPVGLVGSTGNSTGPHLHLAFDPALTYPQDEPWFEAFAGRAFSWQDAPTPPRQVAVPVARTRPQAASSSGPVFRVVRPARVIKFTR